MEERLLIPVKEVPENGGSLMYPVRKICRM
jgi:hypothetical protein